jgi:flagellar basal body L-ring protein FlgH
VKTIGFLIACFYACCALGMLSGCAGFLGTVRQDIDDLEQENGPVVGGRWSERGILAQEYGDPYAQGDRYPAGLDGDSRYQQQGNQSWVSGEQADANRRDLYRYGEGGEDGEAPVISSGAVPNMEPAMRRQYKNGARATRADFIDETKNEGSLWGSDGQTNYYFTKNKIRGVGDIVTLTVEADLVRDIGLEIRRSLSPKEKERELEIANQRLALGDAAVGPDGKPTDQVASSAAAPARAPAADSKGEEKKPAREATLADVDVSKSLALKATDTMMGEVIERYPNGNYKIRATKRVAYSNGASRLVNLIAVVKGTDISEEDVVASGKLYEYRIEANR